MGPIEKYIKKRKEEIEQTRIHFMSSTTIRQEVLNQTKHNKNVIYGARAMNKQLHPPLYRETSDWDIYSKRPRGNARQMEKKLDKLSGGDNYYITKGKHKGTTHIIDKGIDIQSPKDDIKIIDYTTMPNKIRTTKFNGVMFEHLDSITKGKHKTLKNPKSKRYRKDKADLDLIQASNMLKKTTRKI